MRFRGKVSWWFYAIMIGVAGLQIPLIIVSAFIDPNVAAFLMNLVIFVSVEVFCVFIAIHNFVDLEEESLLIVFGFLWRRIPYSEITALTATNNPLSSLAASLDRIEIRCRNKASTMIAVMDKERFFLEMKKRMERL